MPAQRPRERSERKTVNVTRIETTKQAKARYRRSGGQQWTPTRGQVNAADLWNKQEEQQRKGREREEKKKREAIRQAQKDARLKEIQEEMLRKGRITIEETWGKVNASQNRLHKFFGPPRCQHGEAQCTTRDCRQLKESEVIPAASEGGDNATRPSERESSPHFTAAYSAASHKSLQGDIQPLPQSVTHNPSSSPSRRYIAENECGKQSTNLKRKRDTPTKAMSNPTSARPMQCTDKDSDDDDEFPVSASQSLSQSDLEFLSKPSQLLMPPPQRPEIFSVESANRSVPEQANHALQWQTRPLTAYEQCLSPTRLPLSEMTESQLNIRSMTRPDADGRSKYNSAHATLHGTSLISTQVLTDTISGLSSQDFRDDITESDKENSSPVHHASQAARAVPCQGESSFPRPESNAFETEDIATNGVVLLPRDLAKAECQDNNSDYDGFDDFGLDDETLMCLAATQQLKKDLCWSMNRDTHDLKNSVTREKDPHGNLSQLQHSQANPKKLQASDSFAFSGVDEDDLIECIQTFEGDDVEDDSEDEVLADSVMLSVIEQFEKARDREPIKSCAKRESLPWVRYPIEQSRDESQLGLSQQTEELHN